jgi:integrase
LVRASRIAAVSLQIDHVADRYWQQVGQHHAGAHNTSRDLARLVEYFGKSKLLTDITDADVAKLVAWRRGSKGRADRLISNATVNRSTTEVLKKLFTFCKTDRVIFEREPHWRKHWLTEPVERVRELHDDEAARIEATIRPDYKPFFDFVRASGMRRAECVGLRWSEVNWGARQIVKLGKGRKRNTFPITPSIRGILWPLQGHHPEFVFTYIAQRDSVASNAIKGERYPITPGSMQAQWARMRAEAGVSDFRFHDFRHDFATKTLRLTGNIKLVSRLLNHSNIATTARYAHVLDEDLAAAVELVAESREKSRRAAPTSANLLKKQRNA